MDEIISEIEGPIQEFTKTLAKQDYNIPTTTIAEFSRGPLGHKVSWIRQPSKIIENPNIGGNPPNVDTGSLHEPAEWLVENHLLPEHDTDGLPHEDIVGLYSAMLTHVAGLMMDYSGNVQFSREYLKAAFGDIWTSREITIIVPLINYVGPVRGPQLPLSDELNVDNAVIAALSEEERSGIYTYEYSDTAEDSYKYASQDPTMPAQWKYGIKIWLKSDDEETDPLRIAKKILTALRLFQPENEVHLGPIYSLATGWLTERTGLPIVVHQEETSEVSNVDTDKYALRESDSDFLGFWNQFKNQIDQNQGPFVGILNRLNFSYQRDRPEDQLVDCVIGFEESLLKGINQTESYRFRLPLRGSLLTAQNNNNREERFRFFRDLYDARSMIVHENEDLEKYTKNYDSEVDFIQSARSALADVIIEYMKNLTNGVNFDQTNQELDRAVKNAEYAPEKTRGSE